VAVREDLTVPVSLGKVNATGTFGLVGPAAAKVVPVEDVRVFLGPVGLCHVDGRSVGIRKPDPNEISDTLVGFLG
jgi:hypothetical protein